MKCYFFAVLLLVYLASSVFGGIPKWREILPERCGYNGMLLRRYLKGSVEVTTSTAPVGNNSDWRVVNGAFAKISDHPWQAFLINSGDKEYKCAGTIISKYHVLSAAHCFILNGNTFVDTSHYSVALGTARYDEYKVSFPIKELYIHKHFRCEHHRNDIALIKIDGEFKWTPLVFPICLPSMNESYTPGRQCVISGFGDVAHGQRNDLGVLQYGVVNITTDKFCKRYNEKKLGKIADGMFCASRSLDRIRTVDACKGDSGGPLQCEDRDRRYLLGITSFGYRCGLKLYPGIYTKVVKYLPWIYERVEHSLGHTYFFLDDLPDEVDIGAPFLNSSTKTM